MQSYLFVVVLHLCTLACSAIPVLLDQNSRALFEAPTPTPVAEVEVVHVVQTCHLDVGFALTAAGELQNYLKYFLQAAATANDFRQNPGQHGEGLKFTTHSYLVSLLTDCPPNMGFTCPTEDEKNTIENAIRQGDIVMQAFPFNSETETYSRELFAASLQLTKMLAHRYNVSEPTTMTQRDVPGTTIASLALLAEYNITAYSGGVNDASLPPHAPRVFLWRQPAADGHDAHEILAMLHPFGYGGINITDCVVVPGLKHALCPDYKGDNQGPWSREDIESHWKYIQSEFPNARIIPSSFDEFIPYLATVRDKLPVVTQEMGDTWLYGVPSDPLKVAQYREMSRAFSNCVAANTCPQSDPRVANFTRLVIKNSEHTWGGDVKLFLDDTINWDNQRFHDALDYWNFKQMISTWVEQRNWGIKYAIDALDDHPLSEEINARFQSLKAIRPSPADDGFVQQSIRSFQCGDLSISFSDSGAISQLQGPDGWNWAKEDHLLGEFVYQAHSTTDYYTFFNEYAQRDENGNIPWFFPMDFGKPGLYNNPLVAQNYTEVPKLVSLWSKSLPNGDTAFWLQMQLENTTFHSQYGAPEEMWANVTVSNNVVHMELLLINKTATRLPESLWFRFQPNVQTFGSNVWRMDKLGQWIDPLSVITNGSRHLHAVETGFAFATPAAFSASTHKTHTTSSPALRIRTLDAPVISWGDQNPFPTPSGEDFQPDLTRGASVCLFDNEWGTNYIMWYPYLDGEENIKYRFSIELTL